MELWADMHRRRQAAGPMHRLGCRRCAARGPAVLCILGVFLAIALSPQSAAATEPVTEPVADAHGHVVDATPMADEHQNCTHGGHHKAHTRNLFGAKALVVTSWAITGADETGAHGESPEWAESGLGVSIFYERELVANWLEIEPNLALIDGPVGMQVAIDLLLKKPFHIGRRLTPYLSLGPALELFPKNEHSPLFGITGGVGVYVWPGRDFGLDIEIDYTAHFVRPGIEHVTTFGIGPVVHF